MNCERVREMLFLLIDGEERGDLVVSVREHVTHCPRCARRLDRSRRVLTVFRERCNRTAAPPSLRERILTSLPHRLAGSRPVIFRSDGPGENLS